MNKRLLFTCLLGYFGKTSSSEQSKPVLCQKHEDCFPKPDMNKHEKVLYAQLVSNNFYQRTKIIIAEKGKYLGMQ